MVFFVESSDHPLVASTPHPKKNTSCHHAHPFQFRPGLAPHPHIFYLLIFMAKTVTQFFRFMLLPRMVSLATSR